MKFLQRLALVALISSIFVQTQTLRAQAEENENILPSTIPFHTAYSYRNDPLLIDWTFFADKDGEVGRAQDHDISTEYTDEEEALLAKRWYEKQADKWAKLPKGKFIINASAYTAAADECGKNDGKTSSGLMVEPKRTLACPAEYPFGAKIKIAGVGVLRCEDRGGAIKGNHFDIYMETKKEAFAFGRRNLEAEVVND